MLRSLMVDTKSAWVSYPAFSDFEVEITQLSRKEMQNLRKRCLEIKFDKRTRMPQEKLDEEKYIDEFTKATLKNWRGLKLEYLQDLVLIDTAGQDLNTEVPYSHEDAVLLVKGSPDFDQWLTEAVFDLENFRDGRERGAVETSQEMADES